MLIEIYKDHWVSINGIQQLLKNDNNTWNLYFYAFGNEDVCYGGITEEVAQKILSLTGSK